MTRSTAWRCGELAHFFPALVGNGANRGVDEIADHRLDVAADVTDLGVFGCLDFDERARRPSAAKRRAISVLPTPVGPIMRMFFGVISSRRSSRARARR